MCRLWLTRVQNSCNSRGVLPGECTICKQPNGNSLTLTTSNTSYSCWIRLSPLDQYKITPHTTNYSSLHQRGEKKTKTKQTQSQKAAKREFCTIIFTRIPMGVLYNNFYKDLHGISSLFTGLPTCLGPTVFYCVHHDLCGVSWTQYKTTLH